MLKRLFKSFSKIEVQSNDSSDILGKIIYDKRTVNPFKLYRTGNGIWVDSSNELRFELSCSYQQLMEYASHFKSIYDIKDYSSVGSLFGRMSKKEYDKYYDNLKYAVDVIGKFEDIFSKYKMLNTLEKNEFDETFYQTLEVVYDALDNENYCLTEREYSHMLKIISLINEYLNQIEKDAEKEKIEKLELEIQYLELQKQNREQFNKLIYTEGEIE